MNRKTKIIVSVAGIVIVTLALLGITYAYYLTRIEGNTNTNSISLTTANLLLKYDDGTGAIVEENIMPGASFTKTFSVTNEGNATVDNYVVYLEEIINDLTRTQDLTYTLTCDNCIGSHGIYPKLSTMIATNSIEVGETHNYTLKVTYENLTNTDQSIDMGSRISGYIQIYNLQDIVDITGSVVNATDGDYVQINSEPKISQIVDGKYTLGAVEPGNHTISVRYNNENGDEQIRSTKEITIQKGNKSNVEGNIITVTNDSQTVILNIDATNANNTTINNTIKDYNPFEANTLAYNIFKNSKENKNGTLLVSKPASKIGQEPISNNWEHGEEVYEYPSSYFKYAFSNINENDIRNCVDGYESENGGWITDCKKATKFNTCTDELIGKYIVDENKFWDENIVSTHKVLGCDNDKIIIKKNRFESILTVEEDDYGTTYYYRGAVKDNYVNFAGMCWRIVRIDGKGNVKLTLEDKNYLCNSESFDGNYIIGTGNYGYTKYAPGTLKDSTNNTNEVSITLNDYLEPKNDVSNSMIKKFYDFQNTLSTTITNNYNGRSISELLYAGNWCMGNNAYLPTNGDYNNYSLVDEDTKIKEYLSGSVEELVYDSFAQPKYTFKCTSKTMNEFKNVYDGESLIISKSPMYVSTLSNNEFLFAGGINYLITEDFYLIDKSISENVWLLYPSQFIANYDGAFYYNGEKWLDNEEQVYGTSDYIETVEASYSLRPSIVIKSNVQINTGNGTQTDPYTIK